MCCLGCLLLGPGHKDMLAIINIILLTYPLFPPLSPRFILTLVGVIIFVIISSSFVITNIITAMEVVCKRTLRGKLGDGRKQLEGPSNSRTRNKRSISYDT